MMKAGATDERVLRAFARIPREDFLGPGPWRVATAQGYHTTPSADPVHVYQDAVIALDEQAGVNNGEPSLHARAIAALALRAGMRVAHVGAGSGYYSAILAELIGPNGSLVAYEMDDALAARAVENLRFWRQARVVHGNGATAALPPCDALYVSCAAERPMDAWLDALAVGGRLLFPLAPRDGGGAMLLVTRTSGSRDAFAARFLTPCLFIPCAGAEDEMGAESLRRAFAAKGMRDVRTLWRGGASATGEAWAEGDGWRLSAAPPGGGD